MAFGSVILTKKALTKCQGFSIHIHIKSLANKSI